MILKFFNFLCVGLLGMIIDFSVTSLCKEKLNINKYISNSLGFSLAALSNFYFNRIYTFKSNNPDIMYEFYWFMGISIVSLFIYNSIVWIGINKVNIGFYFSKVMGIFVITFWNFFAHLLITFQNA